MRTAEEEARIWEEEGGKAGIEMDRFRERIDREGREREKVEAEREAIEAKRRLELFVTKSTMPYSEARAQEVCERISCGELLLCVCNDDHLPTTRRFTQWLKEHGDLDALYRESLNDRLNIFEEQVILIADDASRDFKEVVRNGRAMRVLHGEAIARAKLGVEVRFRHLKAGRPERWGDSTTLNVNNKDPSAQRA